MDVAVEIVNAFIDGDGGGNPAGVVLDADPLGPEQRLRVAREVGVSETAFVSSSTVATLRLEFFTPRRQIAHCGHATIATFCRLRELGRVADGALSKETVDGMRAIIVEGETAFMEQTAPRFTPVGARSPLEGEILRSLGLARAELLDGHGPAVVDTGNAFLIVPLREAQVLRALAPDFARISALSEQLDLIGYYAFALGGEAPGRAATTRMFAPRYGIDEESATGMAAGPLACWLRARLGLDITTLLIEQGRFMRPPSPSVIQVNLALQDGAIRGLMAGGRARKARSLRVRL